MTYQCAWCGLILGKPERAEHDRLSHGICRACAEAMLIELQEIDGLGAHCCDDAARHEAQAA